ncbi:MAG: hypothetical protein O3B31_07495 [Chloroflexi bacterium]|nr:hypothetical protein [Chloroflexota bacterium]MDA1003180.1 hypothetical protein [Chloroflexota bacterium]
MAVAAFATPDRVRATATFFAGSTTLSLDKSSASPGTGLYAGIAGIQLSEVVNDDFAPGTTHTLILLVPAGFESRHPWPRDARTGAG